MKTFSALRMPYIMMRGCPVWIERELAGGGKSPNEKALRRRTYLEHSSISNAAPLRTLVNSFQIPWLALIYCFERVTKCSFGTLWLYLSKKNHVNDFTRRQNLPIIIAWIFERVWQKVFMWAPYSTWFWTSIYGGSETEVLLSLLFNFFVLKF